MDSFRRVGAHKILLPNGETLHQAVVELNDGMVCKYYEFYDELPFTEWLGGVIEIYRDGEDVLRAVWQLSDDKKSSQILL